MENAGGGWGLAAGLGALVLLAVLIFGWLRSQSRNASTDPGRSLDDPSKGMNPTDKTGG